MRPLIAVAGWPLDAGRVSNWPNWPGVAVPRSYVDALHRAGAQEAILQPLALEAPEAAALLGRFDGLLLIGGGDMDPSLYGQQRHPAAYEAVAERDAFEIAVVLAAIGRGMPALAICRGIQVLNVALGGSLDQHITGRDGDVGHGIPGGGGAQTHEVRLEPGSRTSKAMGAERADVSSSHHQALDVLGRGLVAVGWSEDGIVEAVEHPDGWVVGVQWHPEETAASDPSQQGLFDEFVLRAGA